MSLINDALKRAARQRQADQAGYAPPVPGQTGGGHAVTHRGKPLGSQALILIVAGAAALIVVSVVITVYLLRDDPAPRPTPLPPAAPIVATTAQTAPATDTAPQVVLQIPPSGPAPTETVAAEPKPQPTPPTTTPVAQEIVTTPAPAAGVPVSTPAQPAATTAAQPLAPTAGPAQPSPAAASTPAPVAPAVTPDQQVLVYLDNLRIMGVRFSGLDSKVLIGDRVYRINDVIERNFGLKLVEVQPDRLYFVDARGVTYAKNL